MSLIVGIVLFVGVLFLIFGVKLVDALDSKKEKDRQNKIQRLQSLKQSYPDAFVAWYGDESNFYSLTDYELDSRISRSLYEWQSKQNEIEHQREQELRAKKAKFEAERREKERVDQICKKANEICKKYPNAIKKRIGGIPVITEEYAKKVLSFSLQALQLEETELRDEIRRAQEEISKKYKAIESRFPHGIELVKKLRTERKKIKDIYTPQELRYIERKAYINNSPAQLIKLPEAVFQKYDSISIESAHMESWSTSQSDFSSRVRSLRASQFLDYGYYYYEVSIEGVDEEGNPRSYPFKIWQVFKTSFCCSKSIDYSNHKIWQERVALNQKLLDRERYFAQSVYDQLSAFIEAVDGAPIVIFSDSGLGAGWGALENYHFSYIKGLLHNKGITTLALKDLEQIDNYNGSVIFVVDLITNNENLKSTCLRVLKRTRQRKSQIVYFSLRKEFSESEASEIIDNEEKEKREAEERARRERVLQEQREREETERRAREAREAEERQHREETARRAREERSRLISLAHTQKANAWEFRNYLTSNGIRYLYHFTDRRNLDSIRKNGGLYSWYYCVNHNIDIPYPGGGEQSRSLDRWHGLQDYVRLSFCDDHPMAYRLRQDGYNLVLLRIKIDVALLEDTLFSDINAADNAHHHGKTMEDLRRVDFSATQQHYVSSSSPIFKKHQAEVLVKSFIPLEYIENINNPIFM